MILKDNRGGQLILLTKHKVQEVVENTNLTGDEIEQHMRLMYLEPEPYIEALVIVMSEVLKDKIIDELGRIQ